METSTIDIISPPRETRWKDSAGSLLLTLSAFIFGLTEYLPDAAADSSLQIFFLHYFLALGFTGVLLHQKRFGIRRCWQRQNIHHTTLSVTLFLISAFALNRVLPVFDESTTWLCFYIVVTSTCLLTFRLYSKLPSWVRAIQFLVLGSALIYYTYLSLYVAPYYAIGGAGILALGIGAHALVPVFLLAVSASHIIHFARTFRLKCFVAVGMLATFGVVIAFSLEWNRRISEIETFSNKSVLSPDGHDLPLWVQTAQHVANDWISERILKSDLVYTTAPEKSAQFEFFPFHRRWEEPRRHDPLVYLATLNKKTSLSGEDRIRILRAITGTGHHSEERYWSGESLTTSYIVSDIDIYPDLRIAYTEKYFNIRNNQPADRPWSSTEEAIYTFQLPEGSVISSLSLWINGKEEKALLTSREKAHNAYKTIVGVEQRDPSVVHWQEGNTVVVRVFPCTPEEERKFKIGVTMPLPVVNGKTIYRNVTFAGPDAAMARETTRIRFHGRATGVEIPHGFRPDKSGNFISEHAYTPDLSITFDRTPLRENRFSFDGFTYAIADHTPALQPAVIDAIYLDLNRSWTYDELEEIRPLIPAHRFYAMVEGRFIRITPKNWNEVVPGLARRNFSLFPFHLMEDPAKALVLTKGSGFSPHLSDFRDSRFAQDISRFFRNNHRVKVLNLPGGISTYIGSLRELRTLDFVQGDMGRLKSILQSREYPVAQESDGTVVLHDAAAVITREVQNHGDGPNTAPDHLARLFVYNSIMHRIGSRYFQDDFSDQTLVAEASKAYVVTPLSSLVVLESRADYERFGIHQTENSLYNASKKATGAVPEPHEWALLVLFVLFALFVKFRN